MADAEDAGLTPVSLNVYDLSQGMARQLSAAFLGAHLDAIYHTGIVAYGTEFWFGNGIERGTPGRTYFGPPLRTMALGSTAVPLELFEEFLQGIHEQFNPSTYSLLHNNCNHFSDEAAQFLVGSGIPKDIVDLPQVVLNSPQGQLLAGMLQNMEASLRNGRMPPPGPVGFPLSAATPMPSFPPQAVPPAAPAPTSTRSPAPKPATQAAQAFAGPDRLAASPATDALRASSVPGLTAEGGGGSSASKARSSTSAKGIGGDGADRTSKPGLEDEIKREFAVLMALGNIGANEAAAEALRRVAAKRKESTLA